MPVDDLMEATAAYGKLGFTVWPAWSDVGKPKFCQGHDVNTDKLGRKCGADSDVCGIDSGVLGGESE